MIEETETVETETTALYAADYFVSDDIVTLMTLMLFAAAFALLITWTINFIPDFMRSLVLKIKNRSVIYDSDYLDRTDLGDKTLSDYQDEETFLKKWFNKIRTWR